MESSKDGSDTDSSLDFAEEDTNHYPCFVCLFSRRLVSYTADCSRYLRRPSVSSISSALYDLPSVPTTLSLTENEINQSSFSCAIFFLP